MRNHCDVHRNAERIYAPHCTKGLCNPHRHMHQQPFPLCSRYYELGLFSHSSWFLLRLDHTCLECAKRQCSLFFRQTPARLGNLPISFIPLALYFSFPSPHLKPIDTSLCEGDVPSSGTEKGPISLIGISGFHSYKEGCCTGLSSIQAVIQFTYATCPISSSFSSQWQK